MDYKRPAQLESLIDRDDVTRKTEIKRMQAGFFVFEAPPLGLEPRTL